MFFFADKRLGHEDAGHEVERTSYSEPSTEPAAQHLLERARRIV
jgi:hypothetical protein